MTELIDRPRELARLRRWRDKDVVKVITGVRRCGKSTLLAQFARELREDGVPTERIVVLNMEDFSLAHLLGSARAFHDHVAALLAPQRRFYLFVDEIQLVDSFELALNSLALTFDVDIYVTGSNAQMLSSDLATRLAGRYVEIHLLPFSYTEFARGREIQGRADEDRSYPGLYASFVRWGGFPLVQELLPDADSTVDYLEGLVNTVLVKDVAIRQRVANMAVLRDVTAYLLHNVGNLTSLKRISDSLTSLGRKPSPNTVDGYLAGLIDAFLLYPVRRWDTKGLRFLAGPAKYYAVDTGLRNVLVGYTGDDAGHLLENIVFLKLRRSFSDIRTGVTVAGEVDFVTVRGADVTYYQVAQSVRSRETLERELRPLESIKDNYPKVLLTLDAEPVISHGGINQVYVLDWLRDQELS